MRFVDILLWLYKIRDSKYYGGWPPDIVWTFVWAAKMCLIESGS